MTREEELALRRRPNQARAHATFERLLDAAAELLQREGLGALNTNAVAAAAGVTPPTLYRYFPNKEAVLVALAERYLEAELRWSEGLERIADPEADAHEVLAAVVERYADASDAHPAIGPLRSAMRALPVLAPLEARALDRVSEALAEGLGARLPSLPKRRRLAAARTIVETICNTVDRTRGLSPSACRSRRSELVQLVGAYLASLDAQARP